MRVFRILMLSGFLLMVLQSAAQYFDPRHSGCACSRLSSHARLGKSDKTSGSETDQKYYRFHWFIDPDTLFISGSVTSHHKMRFETDMLSFDLSSNLTVDSVLYHGLTTRFLHDQDVLSIFLPLPVPAGVLDSVSIHYQGSPLAGEGFGSFVKGSHDGIPIIWTLSQPYGCSDWWPCKNGLTDKIDSIDIMVTSPLPYRTASNGLLVNEWIEDGKRTCHWKHRYPIVPYLIAVSVTDYAVYSDWALHGSDSIEVLNYVFPSQLTTIQNQTPNLLPVMDLFNYLFEPYPFILEKYGHAQFGWGGGMEHQTMSFMGSFGHELMAHELAHSWFGNKITTGSWEDIWINEGFATYLTGLTYEHLFDGYYWPFWKKQNISWVTSQPGGSVHVDDTTSVARIFDSRLSYSKGALILHTLRWVIGDDAFFGAIQNMLNHPGHAYGFIRTTEVIGFFEEASGLDLTYFFDQWYYGQGYPSYEIYYQTLGQTEALITLNQSQSHASVDFFRLPVPLMLKNSTNDTLVVLDNTFNGQSFTIDPGFIPDSVFFDPDDRLITRDNQVVIGINELLPERLFRVFPNPARDVLMIESDLRIDAVWFITPDGRIAAPSDLRRINSRLLQVNTAGMGTGFRMLGLQSSGKMYYRKLLLVEF